MQVAYIGIILYLCTDFPQLNGKIIAIALTGRRQYEMNIISKVRI